jgi:TRAP-type C4-dicarboxylate transport system permease small subunit
MARRFLDGLYAATAALAALSLIAIAAIIVLQVAARWLGTQFRGADDFAGFALAATSFLALAPTYRRAEHIRVGLLIERLAGKRRLAVEIVALTIAIAGVAWATWWIWWFVYDSWRFNELSQGLVPAPLWIPQSAMLVGLGVLLIALLEDLIRAMRGHTPSYLDVRHAAEAPPFER